MTKTAIRNGLDAPASACIDENTSTRALEGMFHSLQKIAIQNNLQRSKHPNDPPKFMESELALHQELTKWKQLAAFPSLFIHITNMQQDVIPLFLSLFTHENTDIRFDIVAILAEWFDIDNLGMISEKEVEFIEKLATGFCENKCLQLLVEFLSQLLSQAGNEVIDEASDSAEGKQKHETDVETGIYNALQVFENMAELAPEHCVRICEESDLLSLLLKLASEVKKDRATLVMHKTTIADVFPQLRVYASELLSIFLQLDTSVQVAFLHCSAPSRDGNKMDGLLRLISFYRQSGPRDVDEEEFIENIINALCVLLLLQDAKAQFRRLEGLELILKVFGKRDCFLFGPALRILDHALMESPRNCEHLIELGGLRFVFSILMGKMSRYKAARENKGATYRLKQKQEEHIMNVIASLCVHLPENAGLDGLARFHAKFFENEFEKMDRLVDLFARNQERLKKLMHEQEIADNNREIEVMTEEDKESIDDNKLIQQLDAGLYSLQRISLILAHCSAFSQKLRSFILVKFHERQLDYEMLETFLANGLHTSQAEVQ